MGLDNGIVVRTKEQSQVFGWVQKTVFQASDEPTLVNDDSGYKYEYDVTYWRKCYGIRSFILSVYRRNHPDDKQMVDILIILLPMTSKTFSGSFTIV